MNIIQLELEGELTELLQQLKEPVESAVREVVILELYRRGQISSGKAAALLGMSRLGFIRYASGIGIPYFDFTAEQWEDEVQRSASL